MARRHHHYEAAFEHMLRERRVPYVAVDEKRRSLIATASLDDRRGSLKSVDFLVSPPGPWSLLVDVKGRRFPSGTHQKQYWRNWSTRDDLRSLAEWARHFGADFVPLLVFAFDIVGDRSPLPVEQLWSYRKRRYAFLAVALADYWRQARTLSARWDTVSLPAADFRRLAGSFHRWLSPAADHLQADTPWDATVGG